MELRLAQIGQIHIPITDLPRAIRFYRDSLGLPFLFEVPRMAFFDCGGIRLMLGLPDRPEFAPPGSVLYYRVDDIHAAFAALKARGVKVEDKPHLVAKLERVDLWLAFLRDSEGNLFSLMSELPR